MIPPLSPRVEAALTGALVALGVFLLFVLLTDTGGPR